ncbi:MAG TPA: hypothetical protein VHP83_01905 [Aggregatilineaceae bacterium]|nr:hypothetical protein [Aggregatilineaceae bacterium]
MLPDNRIPDNEEIPPPPPPPPAPPPFYGGAPSPYGPPLSPLPPFGAAPVLPDQPGFRPGCITAYVILMLLGVVMAVCGGLSFLIVDTAPSDTLADTKDCYNMGDHVFCGTIDEVFEEAYGVALSVFAVIMFGLAVLNGITAVGLWRMKKWGWVLLLLSLGLSLFLGTLNLLTGNVYAVVTLIVAGLILYWFVQNRWRFV